METKIKKLQDDDSHWYWIPEEQIKQFESDLDEICGVDYMDNPDAFDDFNDNYDVYRTGGHPDNVPKCFEEKEVVFL